MIWNVGLFLLVECILVVEIESASYTRIYDGHIFTSPGLSAYRNKDEAQRLCNSNGSNLLEINSSYVESLIFRFLNDTEVQFQEGTLLFTNGIRNDGNNWNWVNGQGRNSITVTGQGQGLAYSFGYIDFNPQGLTIAAGTPIENRGYICQGTFNCTSGFRRNGVCYKSYSNPTVSWFDARNRCLDEGGDLASLDFINDNQGLNSILNGNWLNPPGSYWIGIRRQWWTWQTSNLEVRYSNWLNGRPVYVQDDKCLCIKKNGAEWKWIECNCNYVYPFVCVTVLPSTPLQVTTTTAASKDKSSFGFKSTTATQLNPQTKQPSVSNASTLSSTSDVNNDNVKLGVGIGVGIGGFLLIAAIVIVVFILVRKRGCPRTLPVSNPPDVTLHPIDSHYVEISKQPGNEISSTPFASSNQFTSPPPVYADLDIITEPSSLFMEKDSVFLINARTMTLAPPRAHKETTHVTVDGQQYAEIKIN